MPSRPVLIGRGLVTHPKNKPKNPAANMLRVHYTVPEIRPHNKTKIHMLCKPEHLDKCYGDHSERETPGPIPNPEVKPFSADGTATARLWESRTSPDNNHT